MRAGPPAPSKRAGPAAADPLYHVPVTATRAAPRPFRAAVMALVASLCVPALAGVHLYSGEGRNLHWDIGVEQPNVKGGAITWFAEAGGSEEEPPGDEVEEDAIAAGFAAWQDAPGSRVRFAPDSTRPAYGLSVSDRVNFFQWKKYQLGPFSLAVTYVQSNNSVIIDSDTLFNDTVEFVRWATTETGLAGHADVRAVATHEIGHLLGLDHSPVQRSSMAALLPTGAIHSRSLEPDDVGTLLSIYPGPSDPTVGAIHGTVRIGKAKTKRGIAVFAIDSRAGTVVASALTRDDGRYSILALPPGPYLVAATPVGAPGTLVPYWSKAPSVESAFHVDQGPDGEPRPAVVVVRAGAPEVEKDVTVARPPRGGTGEPDDDAGRARELPYRGAAVGAFEKTQDPDWFLLRVPDGAPVDIRVRSWGMGSEGNAELAAFASDGVTPLGSVIDDRPGIFPQWAHGPEGVDLDASLERLVPPPDGEILVRVRVQPQADTGTPRSFYVVTAFPSGGVPWQENVSTTLTPASLRAGSTATATLVVTPRDVHRDPLPPGAEVLVTRTDGGGPIPMEPLGDGSFRAVLAAPATRGTVGLSLTVRSADREFHVPQAALLQGAGAVDAATTAFTASPRRVEADGSAQTLLRIHPLDAQGLPLGRALDLAITFDGPPSGLLGPTVDDGTGSYTATLRAPAAPGSVRMTATVDGAPTGVSRTVGFGFDLGFVAADLGGEVTVGGTRPGLTPAEARTLTGAATRLDGLLLALAADDPVAAGSAAADAVALLSRAGIRGTLPEGEPAAAELAEALRRRARSLILTIVFHDPDPKSERALGRSRALLARGEATVLRGDIVSGSRRIAAALRAARRIL